METNKIRIGNDIRLAVTLRQYFKDHNLLERHIYNPEDHTFEEIDTNPFVNKKYELYYGEHFYDHAGNEIDFNPEGTPISIISVRAILINNTREQEIKELRKQKEENDRKAEKDRFDALRKHSRFIARFPIEPAMECFNATPYDICGCGYPTYRAYPRAFLFAPYHGFGVKPEWEGVYKPLFPCPAFPPGSVPPPDKEEEIKDDSKYLAEVAATNHQNIVEVLFPAAHQLHPGTYSMVIVAKLYCPGFNANNTKTVTLDVPNVFELVKTTEDAIDGDVTIHVNNITDVLSGTEIERTTTDIYVDNAYLSSNFNKLILDRTDGIGLDVNLDKLTDIYDAD